MEFDETQAIKYMRAHTQGAQDYDDDELLNLIDIVYDYYEANGLLDIDADSDEDDDEPNADDIAEYAVRMIKKDKGAKLDIALVPALVAAYLEYESSLD
jgi:hypothetical protein